MTGPEVEAQFYEGFDRRKKCETCEHDCRWHCSEGCMLPACDCRNECNGIREARHDITTQ